MVMLIAKLAILKSAERSERNWADQRRFCLILATILKAKGDRHIQKVTTGARENKNRGWKSQARGSIARKNCSLFTNAVASGSRNNREDGI